MSDFKIDRKLVVHAVKVLQELNKKYYEDSSKKKPLIDDDNYLYLQVTLKKVKPTKNIKKIKVKLPHSLTNNTTEICLIAGDLDKRNKKAEIAPDILHYEELLKKNSISQISEVVTLRQLRTEYKPYEAKQKLLAAYDIFIADSKIHDCLPRVLGRHFFTKRKFPFRIDMKKSLKNQIENALSSKIIYLTGHGNSCTSEVALLHMDSQEVYDNVLSMVESLVKELPGSLENVMGFYLKTARSKAIPIYISYDNPNKIILPESDDEEEFTIDELSTLPNAKVKVYKTGKVETVKNSTYSLPDVEEAIKSDSENSNESDGEESERNPFKNESNDICEQVSTDAVLTETENVKKQKKTKLRKKVQGEFIDLIAEHVSDTSDKSETVEGNISPDVAVKNKRKRMSKADKSQKALIDDEQVSNMSKSKKEKKEKLLEKITTESKRKSKGLKVDESQKTLTDDEQVSNMSKSKKAKKEKLLEKMTTENERKSKGLKADESQKTLQPNSVESYSKTAKLKMRNRHLSECLPGEPDRNQAFHVKKKMTLEESSKKRYFAKNKVLKSKMKRNLRAK